MIGFEGYSERVQINSDGSSEKASPDEPEYSSAPSETCFVKKKGMFESSPVSSDTTQWWVMILYVDDSTKNIRRKHETVWK